MRLTYRLSETLLKLFFTAILLQLFGIALGADSGAFSPSEVTAMLEYSMASCTVALGGGLLFEYILKTDTK